MNRVLDSIARAEHMLEQALAEGRISPEHLANLNRELDMEYSLFCVFQERKTIAMAEGILSLAEANSIYGLLGRTPGTFNAQSLPVKVALWEWFKGLMQRTIRPSRSDPGEELINTLRKPLTPKGSTRLTVEELHKRGFPPFVSEAVFEWIRTEGDPTEERRTFQSVLASKKVHGLAWWGVERAVRYATEKGLDLNDSQDWVLVVERLGLQPEDTLTLPLFLTRRRTR